MDLPTNRFKAALRKGERQIGMWCSLGGRTSPELLATCGYDWIVIDQEHSPIDTAELMAPLQAIAAYPEVSGIVRPYVNDTALIKRVLDMGAQTILVPFVQTADEAEAAARAIRYAPGGVRGVAGATRASRYGKVTDYAARAEEELCLIVQVETAEALDRLSEIATVDGVDGVFFGPSDLSTSMGYRGQPNHPEVLDAIKEAIRHLAGIGVPSGVLSVNEDVAQDMIDTGVNFIAVGTDVTTLAAASTRLRDRFR